MTSEAPVPALRPERITIAIPFYKGLDYLARAIASVFAQTVADWSLVVVDNGGEAATPSFMERFNDARVRYVRNPTNLGMAGNFNRCLDLAETELVTLLHHDDELEPSYAARMLKAAADYPTAAAFFCQATIIDERSQRIFS